MRRYLFVCALFAPLIGACDSSVPGTGPESDHGLNDSPQDEAAPAIAYAALEGTAVIPDTSIIYSCGPGLFGGRTTTSSDGSFNIALQFPDSLRADLPSDRRLGCMVQVPSQFSSAVSIAVPTVTFEAEEESVHKTISDIGYKHTYAPATHTVRDNVLIELSPSETRSLYPLSPCAPQCKYFGEVLHPEVVAISTTSSPQGASISLSGTATGTTTVKVYGIYRKEHGTPDGWTIEEDTTLVGSIGVRVH